MDIEIEGLVALREALKGELGAATLRFVRDVLALPGRVIVCGMGKSGHIGRKVAATLTSTGTPSLFMHPAEASHGDLGMVTSHDMILAFSWSGETKELGDIASYCQRYGVPLAVVTSRRDSWLGATADIVLELPGAKEACPHGLAPTTSTMLQLSLGDAIAIALLEQREFTPANFHRFHPGGKLGSSLRTVGQLMRPMPMVAFVKKEASMSEVVLQMTSQSLGSAFVVTDDMEVLGIVTDGDLRRHMTGDLLALPVSKVFTPNPYTCSPDILGVTALTIMTRHKVNALAVVENRKLVGILTMHMLLSAGIS
ncbi:KpsF/GutQ family sugar-phosphate isomerase [Fulvimarina endophytica]|nr:KpsF/GutQ family sugar-phosphate isomerase [Fulvimarina endophytica]